MNQPQSGRETYQRYLNGEITFDEVQELTDRALEAYDRSWGRATERPRETTKPPRE